MAKHSPAEIAELAGRQLPRLSPGGGALESAEDTAAPDLSLQAVAERWARSRSFLMQFIRTELGDDPALVDLADKVLADGRQGLELIAGHRDSTDAELPQVEAGLEVVVETDGSRPAYLIRQGRIVPDSSPPGFWTDLLTDVIREDAIDAMLGAVGRVDVTHPLLPYAGTGWLVAPDIIVTNRHVAQIFTDFTAAPPRLRAELEPRIDFGHEFGGTDSQNLRPITELLFCGPRMIPSIGIDHSALDIAAFRIGPAAAGGPPQQPLAIGTGARLALPQTQVFLVGYPARPPATALGDATETDRVLRLLFDKLWGFKRLAPGEVMVPTLAPRTLSHDVSTLGGNSGSALVGLDTVPAATGLHYGGSWGSDRVNWAHVLGAVAAEAGLAGLRYGSLDDLCAAEGVDRRAF